MACPTISLQDHLRQRDIAPNRNISESGMITLASGAGTMNCPIKALYLTIS